MGALGWSRPSAMTRKRGASLGVVRIWLSTFCMCTQRRRTMAHSWEVDVLCSTFSQTSTDNESAGRTSSTTRSTPSGRSPQAYQPAPHRLFTLFPADFALVSQLLGRRRLDVGGTRAKSTRLSSRVALQGPAYARFCEDRCMVSPGRVLLSAAQLAAHARQRPGQGDLVNHLSGTQAVQGVTR